MLTNELLQMTRIPIIPINLVKSYNKSTRYKYEFFSACANNCDLRMTTVYGYSHHY